MSLKGPIDTDIKPYLLLLFVSLHLGPQPETAKSPTVRPHLCASEAFLGGLFQALRAIRHGPCSLDTTNAPHPKTSAPKRKTPNPPALLPPLSFWASGFVDLFWGSGVAGVDLLSGFHSFSQPKRQHPNSSAADFQISLAGSSSVKPV